MREIKFRAWVKNSAVEEMIYPNETDTNSAIANALWFKVGYINRCPEKNIIEQWQKDIIFMQFTGLKDKNGVDIYEGDIITYKRSVGNWTGQFMTTIHDVIFSEEVFAFVMKYGSSYIKLRKHWGYEYEVIGNIYETPELMNK